MTKAPASANTLPQPNPADEPLTIQQWAAAKSAADKRVELLNGFVTTELATGSYRGTAAEWESRYAAFANRPIA